MKRTIIILLLSFTVINAQLLDVFAKEKPIGVIVKQYNFSTDANGWGGIRITVTGNNDAIFGKNNVLKGYASADNASHYFFRINATEIPSSTWLKIAIKYYIPSANTNVDGIRITKDGGVTSIGTSSVKGNWTTLISDRVQSTANRFDIFMKKLDAISFAGAGSSSDDIVYISEIIIYEVE